MAVLLSLNVHESVGASLRNCAKQTISINEFQHKASQRHLDIHGHAFICFQNHDSTSLSQKVLVFICLFCYHLLSVMFANEVLNYDKVLSYFSCCLLALANKLAYM